MLGGGQAGGQDPAWVNSGLAPCFLRTRSRRPRTVPRCTLRAIFSPRVDKQKPGVPRRGVITGRRASYAYPYPTAQSENTKKGRAPQGE